MAVILVVEDDALIRMIAEMMIEDWGHETLSASDVDEALSHPAFRRNRSTRYLPTSI